MKNPNGYGSVFKLQGNRRRPYAVRKTVGFNEKGQPIYKFIGYTTTREEGMILLSEYNKEPYDTGNRNLTTGELFVRWCQYSEPRFSDSMKASMKAAWKHCEPLCAVPYRKLNSISIQSCIDGCNRGASTKAAMKNLFRHLDRFALELDVISKSRCTLITSPPADETKRRPFSDAEIQALWDNSDMPCADTVLIFIYTGMRLSELLSLKSGSVSISEKTIVGGVKTTAGKNRVIPIHPDIMPLILRRLGEGGEFLISDNGEQYTKSRYYREWKRLMERLNMVHTPHECRHTFRSLLDSAGANKRCIDLIMGHKSRDVGERVYTHKTIEELHGAVALINVPNSTVETR